VNDAEVRAERDDAEEQDEEDRRDEGEFNRTGRARIAKQIF
jgi:hypothetical protein